MFKRKIPRNLKSREKTDEIPKDNDETPAQPDTKRAKHGIQLTEPKIVPSSDLADVFVSHGEGRIVHEPKVFAKSEIDADVTNDHRAVLERNFEIQKKIAKGELDTDVYRGQGAYRSHMPMREGAISGAKYTGLLGPLRGSQFARTTMRIDYNPEICKDYKETGYCGYGDTCKYIHDRSDYKSGWQIDKEWEELQQKRQTKLMNKLEGKNLSSSSSDSE